MKSVVIIILLLLCASPALAVCSADGSHQWRCTNTGNPAADGLALWNFIGGCPANNCISGGGDPGSPIYACGDFVRVEPGVYDTPVIAAPSYGARAFTMLHQTGCSGPTQRTTFVVCAASDSGSCTASQALVPKRPGVSDLSHMWVLRGTRSTFGGGNVLAQYHVPNNYHMIGFAATTDSDISAVDHAFRATGLVGFGADENSPTITPHDITLEKFWVGNGEIITYGPPVNNTDPNAFYSSITSGMAPQGDNITVIDGTIEIGGFDPRTPIVVTGITCVSSGDRTICGAPGISAAYQLAAVSCPNGADNNCWGANGTKRVAFSGATGSWAGTGNTYPLDGLNGLRTVYYLDADHVGIDSSYKINQYVPVHLDSSGFGAFTGTLSGRLAVVCMPGFQDGGIDPQYSFLVAYQENSRVENNRIQGPWQYFASSAAYTTDYGIIQPGSTATSLIFDSITGNPPQPGDVIGLSVDPNNGQSKWCYYLNGSGIQCGGRARNRAALVNSCTHVGSVYTCAVQAYGSDGLDGEPVPSGTNCPLYSPTGVTLGVDTILVVVANSTDTSLTVIGDDYGRIQVGQVLSIGKNANLAGGIPDTVQTLVQLDNPVIPAGSTISIDREQMCVTAGGGTTNLTVTRGCNSTTKTIHNSSTPVYLVGGVEQIRVCGTPGGGVIQVGVASCPNVDGRGYNGTTASSHVTSSRIQSTVGNFCYAQWGGKQGSGTTAYLHNTFDSAWQIWAYGKGYQENKSCGNILWDGNIFTSALGNWFQDSVAQTPGSLTTGLLATYTTLYNCHISNNIFGGQYGGGQGNGLRGQYYEATNKAGDLGFFEHNIYPQSYFQSPDGGFAFGTYATGGAWTHNTVTLSPSNPHKYTWFGGGNPSCGDPGHFFGDNYVIIPPNFYLTNNLTTFGTTILGYSFPDPSWVGVPGCWQNPTQKVFGNLFVADTWTDGTYTAINNPATILAGWPGNGTYTNNSDIPANIGFAGSCTFATYTNCGLSALSPYKGSASDGGDPGADVLQVQDHLNNWSRTAGLITYDLTRTTNQWYGTNEEAQWVYDPAHWSVVSTAFAPTFTIVNAIGSCTAHVYTDRARLHEHADTATGGSACNRVGNTVVGNQVTFIFGYYYNLSSNTVYYIVINDGANVMTAVPIKTTGTSTPPTITSTSPLPDGMVGIPYSYTFSATGTAPITYSGSGLPGWATLSSGGVLSGTPNAAATTSINVGASNVAGTYGPAAFSITVDTNGVAPTITTSSPLPVGVVTVPYNFTFSASGDAPITWTGTNIPSGLTLDSGGNLSGTPVSSGTTSLHVTATNATGHDGPHDYVLAISDCIYNLNPTTASFPSLTVTGNSVGVTTQAGCAWGVGNVPSWITITGQSTASGPGTFTYTVLNNSGPLRTAALSIGGQSHTVTQSGRTAIGFRGGARTRGSTRR